MKYLKTFEGIFNIEYIKVGDYVVIKEDAHRDTMYDFFINNPSEVIYVERDKVENSTIKLECNNTKIVWRLKDVDYYSKNRDDVVAFIAAKKYNL
jgi:hypothetical protein